MDKPQQQHPNRQWPESGPDALLLERAISYNNETNDPYVDDVRYLAQCRTSTLQWRGTEPPFDVSIMTIDREYVSLGVSPENEVHYELWKSLYTGSSHASSGSADWLVDVPTGTYVGVRVQDALGRVTFSYPSRVGYTTPSDDSCLAPYLRSTTAYPPYPTSVNTYHYHGSSGVYFGVLTIAGIVFAALALLTLCIAPCVCCWQRKKRRREREAREARAAAGPTPVYGQWAPYPGAPPVVYMQAAPGAQWVRVGNTPPAGEAGAAAAVESRPLMAGDRDAPLSRSPSPAPSTRTNATAGPSGTRADEMVQVPATAVTRPPAGV